MLRTAVNNPVQPKSYRNLSSLIRSALVLSSQFRQQRSTSSAYHPTYKLYFFHSTIQMDTERGQRTNIGYVPHEAATASFNALSLVKVYNPFIISRVTT